MCILIFGSGCTEKHVSSDNATPVVTQVTPAPETSQDISDYVKNAVLYAKKVGKAAAIASFNNKSGPFVKGDLYIYAIDFSGTTLAQPYNTHLLGKNYMNVTDASGKSTTNLGISLAKSGGGFLLYKYPKPVDNFTSSYKISYISPVDDTYFIGAGIYTSEDQLIDKTLKKFVYDARNYSLLYGREKALKEFNNLNGPFINGELYIFAYDYNGTLLAWPYRPDLVGANRYNSIDPMGTYHIKAMIDTARNGSGLVDYYSVNPATNMTDLKISYVTNVDGTWFLGSGRYIVPGQSQISI